MGDQHQYLPSKPSQPREEKKEFSQTEYHMQSARRMWDELVQGSPLNRLRYLDARLAQGATVDPNRVAELVREAGAKAVLSDPDAIGLIRQIFGEKGVQRLRHRASTAE